MSKDDGLNDMAVFAVEQKWRLKKKMRGNIMEPSCLGEFGSKDSCFSCKYRYECLELKEEREEEEGSP
jgi:hypothetical protein